MRTRHKVAILLTAAWLVWGCGPKVPPTYSPQAQRASNATQLLQELTALGTTVINLNALPAGSPGRISDADTAAIRDASLALNNAIPGYVSTGVVKGIQDGLASLGAKVTASASLSPNVKAAFALVQTTAQIIIAGVQ